MTVTEYVGVGWKLVALRLEDGTISPLPLILSAYHQSTGKWKFTGDIDNGLPVIEVVSQGVEHGD